MPSLTIETILLNSNGHLLVENHILLLQIKQQVQFGWKQFITN